jgi:hypothetical protein
MQRVTLTLPSGDPITNYSFDDEALHVPGPEENWQESVAMWWFDADAQIGGFMRIGHEPRLDGGNMTLWAFLQTPDWLYVRNEQFPLGVADVKENGLGVGGLGTYSYDGSATHWRVRDAEASFELRLLPLHQPIGLWPTVSADYARNIGGRHFEVADWMDGSISIKGVTRHIKGYAYRDHSWGPRNWFNLRVHRWTNGIFGDDFGFGFSNYMVDQPEINRRGYVRRGTVVHYTREVDILPLMETDGATHRGGFVRARLDDGERFEFTLEPFGRGNMAVKRDNYCYDSPCSVRYGDRTGVGMLEVSENPRSGTRKFDTLVNAYLGNGIFPARR